MSKFWIQFIIHEAISVLATFIASGHLTDVQKAAAQKTIDDGQAFLLTL
jgi:hypothetical protein